MSCSCNCTPCNCQPRPSICCTPTVESISYTFENGNLIGIGVFDNETDQLVQLRGLASNSLSLTISLDAPNKAIIFDFDDAQLVADIPDATTTQRGILETATNAEAIAKAAVDKILTPSNLAALGSSQTFAGLVELATDAETIAGVSDTLAVRPAGLAAFAATQGTTTTFANAVARAAAVPLFEGQFGAQLDTNTPYMAYAAGAGSWNAIFIAGAANVVTIGAPATWQVPDSWNLDGQTSGDITFTDFTNFSLSGTPFSSDSQITFNGDVYFGANVNFDNAARIQDNAVDVPANSVLTTSGTAGQLNSSLINTFVSSANTQTGYTAFANGAVLRTCDTTTVTLPQLAQIVGTLIEDLKAIRLPAT